MSENSMVLKEATPMTTPSGGALGLSTSGVNILSPRPLASPQQAPVSRSIALTPSRLVNSFVHRWPLAIIVGLILAAGGAAIAWATYKPKYVAVAMLKLETNDVRSLPQTNPHLPNRDEEFRRFQTILIRNRDMLAKVLAMPSINGLNTVRSQDDPVTWLEKELNATIVSGTNVMRVTLGGEEPAEVKLILEAVVDEHVGNVKALTKDERRDVASQTGKIILDTENRINEEKRAIKAITERNKTGDVRAIAQKQHIFIEGYGSLRRELLGIESEIRKAQAQELVLKKQRSELPKEAISSKLIEQLVDQRPEVQKHLQSIAVIETKLKEYGEIVTTTSPKLKQLKDELQAANEKLLKVRLQFAPECEARIRLDATKHIDSSILQIKEKIDILNSQKEKVSSEVEKHAAEAELLGMNYLELEERRAEFEESNSFLKRLRAQKDRIELEMLYAQENRVGLLQKIATPTINQNSLVKSTAGFSIAGFFLGVLGICFLDARGQRVFKPIDVQRELGIETLGSFPRVIPNSKRIYGRKKEEAEHEFKQFISESSNRLCATLLCGDRLPPKPVLMVTSACANEGKTTVAAQLVRGFGRAGKKSLLVDCDVRNSRCHQMFGIPAGPGLSEVLRGEATLAEAVRPAASGQFSILTAGSSSGSLLQALSDGTFANILNQLREEYDSIVIDTAPTLLVSEGLLIGKMVDGVLLVVRSKISKAPEVMAVYEQLTSVKIPVYGAIVNEYEPATYKQSYYRGND